MIHSFVTSILVYKRGWRKGRLLWLVVRMRMVLRVAKWIVELEVRWNMVSKSRHVHHGARMHAICGRGQ